MTDLAAVFACIVLAGLTVFQIALIVGAPIGRFAWGGYHDVLPTKLRVASVISIILYIVFSILILAKSGLITTPIPADVVSGSMWVLVGYFSIGIPMNAISRSKPERILMTPVVILLAILFLVVALK